ncbi:nicotinate-nucleotide adenylyltransferase [bacterium]|nr:nicotinate-nucleotide adenylyltransferase [bacterium]NIO18834.1 nicotinate-nucleotide adenylyltransferase [bacterium]
MRIGILGGMFNPIHYGHLVIASEVKDRLNLDKIIFVPAGKAPHKRAKRATPDERYEMVSLAIKENSSFEVSPIEVERSKIAGRPTFTLETIREFMKIYGKEGKIYFIVGLDEMLKISTWKEPHKLLELCKFVVVTRPGYDSGKLDKRIASKVMMLQVPGLEISASDIRKRIRAGKPIRYLLPQSVEEYIRKKRLYS